MELPNTNSLEDYRWLVGPEGYGVLDAMRDCSDSIVTQTRQLRKSLTAARTHLVLEQLELRRRAARKFEPANRMFFTRIGLQQATDQWIAAYKAARFPPAVPVADLCCGIGGDFVPLARQCQATGVDSDPIAALLAETNCQGLGIPFESVDVEDATCVDLGNFAAWHIDPDRRPDRRRTSQLAFSRSSVGAVQRMLATCPNGAVKLAPAAQLDNTWSEIAERQWIGSRGECRQQVAWFGALARHSGLRSAVDVDCRGGATPMVVGTAERTVPVASIIGRYVFEPHACVLAAQLTGTLAAQHQLQAISPSAAYLTGDNPVDQPLLDTFEVTDLLPMDLRRLRAALKERRIGRLEIKKRGVPIDPHQLLKQLKPTGSQAGVLLLAPGAGVVQAILATRR